MTNRHGWLAVVAGFLIVACGSPTNTPTSATTPAASSAPTASTALTSAPPTTPTAPRTVVIDTDMAPDDWIAILYLLGRPEIDVKAITVTGTGEARCEPGVRHALDLAALAGHASIPVACGRENPLAGTNAFPGPWRDAADSLLGLSLPKSDSGPAPGSAVELLTTTVQSAPGNVTVLTLGPLTNVAEALQESPDLNDKIGAIYVMGGAVNVDGNVGADAGIGNQFAEWNVYVDPLAMKMVLDSGVPVSLVPLDATNDAPVTLDFLHRLSTDSGTPQARFARDVLNQRQDFIASGTYFFWDPFAAAVLVDEGLASFESADLTVVVAEGADSGRIIESDDGAQSRYATSADLAHLEQVLIDTLNDRTQ